MARKDVAQILRKYMEKEEDPEIIASCLFAYYVTSVLIPYPAGRGNTTTGSLPFVSSGRAAAVRYQHTGTCGAYTERGVCAGAGNGADCDGNDREDISNLDDLSEFVWQPCVRLIKRIRREPEYGCRPAGRWREKTDIPGTVYRISRIAAGGTGKPA